MNELTSRRHETAGNPVGKEKPGRPEAFGACRLGLTIETSVGRVVHGRLYVEQHHAPLIGLWMFRSELADCESRKKPRDRRRPG